MKHSYHKVGLGQAFLDRAGLIFVLFLLLTISLTGSAIYAEYKTGELKNKFLRPFKDAFSSLGKAFEYPTPNPAEVQTNISTSSGSIKIDINTKTETNTYTDTYNEDLLYSTPYNAPYYTPFKSGYLTPTPYSYPTPLKSYDQLLKEQGEWSKQKEAENQAWYDQKVQESLKELEEWKKAHGF